MSGTIPPFMSYGNQRQPRTRKFVITGLVPGDLLSTRHYRACPGDPRPDFGTAKKDVDGRDKPGHDEKCGRDIRAKPSFVAPPRPNREETLRAFPPPFPTQNA